MNSKEIENQLQQINDELNDEQLILKEKQQQFYKNQKLNKINNLNKMKSLLESNDINKLRLKIIQLHNLYLNIKRNKKLEYSKYHIFNIKKRINIKRKYKKMSKVIKKDLSNCIKDLLTKMEDLNIDFSDILSSEEMRSIKYNVNNKYTSLSSSLSLYLITFSGFFGVSGGYVLAGGVGVLSAVAGTTAATYALACILCPMFGLPIIVGLSIYIFNKYNSKRKNEIFREQFVVMCKHFEEK